jgi:thioredoxin-dependent peroxiredoxin
MVFWQTKGNVGVGSKAPDFTLPSQSGEMVNLKDFLDRKPVVLFFYPKDDTPECTKEACAFRDDYEQFRKLDAEVVGISSDSVESHRGFTKKHGLPFTLLSDEGGKVRRLYDVPNTFGLFPGRVTYVIDEKGVIRHVFSSQLGTKRHVEEALRILPSIGYHNGPKGRLRSFHHWVSEL